MSWVDPRAIPFGSVSFRSGRGPFRSTGPLGPDGPLGRLGVGWAETALGRDVRRRPRGRVGPPVGRIAVPGAEWLAQRRRRYGSVRSRSATRTCGDLRWDAGPLRDQAAFLVRLGPDLLPRAARRLRAGALHRF